MTKTTWCLVVGAALYFLATYAPESPDFHMYMRAAQRVHSGDLAQLFEPLKLTPPKFHYSYFFALCFLPFAWLPPLLSQFVFFSAMALAFVFFFRWSAELARAQDPQLSNRQETLAQVLALIALLHPASRAFVNGNIGLILATMMLGSYRLSSRYPTWAGALLGAATTFKIFPGILFLYFVWSRRWKVVFAAAGFTFLFYLAVPSLLVGPANALDLIDRQFQALADFGRHWPLAHPLHQNFSGFLLRWAPGGLSQETLYRMALGGGVLLPVALLGWSDRLPKTPARGFQVVALLFLWVPLAVPTSWTDMPVYYAPAALLCARAALPGSNRLCQLGFAVFWLGALAFRTVPFFASLALLVAFISAFLPHQFWKKSRP